MIGIGVANIAAGFFRASPCRRAGPAPRSPSSPGAKTQLTGVVGAGLVVVLLLFFNSLLSDLPQTALAGGRHRAALSLTNVAALRKYAPVRPSSLSCRWSRPWASSPSACSKGSSSRSCSPSCMFFRRNWWPHGAVLGRTTDSEGWHNIEDLPDAQELPGIVVYRWEAPLFFANAGSFRQQIRQLVREREPAVGRAAVRGDHRHRRDRGRDARAARRRAQRGGIHLAFVELRSRLQDLVGRYGLYDTLDRDHFYPTIDAALDAISDEP